MRENEENMLNLQNIQDAKNKLLAYNPLTFSGAQNSFRFFANSLEVMQFRHIAQLPISFDHPVTIISGTNKIGKTSLLLLIACSHENFKKFDSTTLETNLRNHNWNDVLSFTSYENITLDYSYKLTWRFGNRSHTGEGKRLAAGNSWTGLGKRSADVNRTNAKIRDREVRLIDLERVLPARNYSASLFRKVAGGTRDRLPQDVEQAFAYILDLRASTELYRIGSHVYKVAYLIQPGTGAYSSYNAASGEEALITILTELFDAPADSLILIDEIEAGFHPTIQRKLADVIQYVSWIHKKQFIITTHSPTLMSAFPQKSRKFIELNAQGQYQVINDCAINVAFSKMDSVSHPLIRLYLEDDLAEFIIKNLIFQRNERTPFFDRLINIIPSGPKDQVKNDYERHKRNLEKMRPKIGFAAVFDGDCRAEPAYATYDGNDAEYVFFLSPDEAPEKFLIRSFVEINANAALQTSLEQDDHHHLFAKMVNLGLVVDVGQARQRCWDAFSKTPAYQVLKDTFNQFLDRTVLAFSQLVD